MQSCPRCQAKNEAHFKFCLSCGAVLPQLTGEAAQSIGATPSGGTSGPVPEAAAPASAPPSVPERAVRQKSLSLEAAIAKSAGAQSASAKSGSEPGSAASGRRPSPRPGESLPPLAAQATNFVKLPDDDAARVAGAGSRPASAARSGSGKGSVKPFAVKPAAEQKPCPNCETLNPANFKFCGACGYPLGAPASKPVKAAHTDKPTGPARRGKLILVRPDGSETEGLSLFDGDNIVGRETHPGLDLDHFLSAKHARFHFVGSTLEVEDLDSRNGVYIRIEKDQPYALESGDYFRVGQHVIRYDSLTNQASPQEPALMGSPRGAAVGRIRLVIAPNQYGNAYLLSEEGLFLGRERGDVLFPDDGYISGLHCRIHPNGSGALVTDLGSSNGTYVRIKGKTAVKRGASVLVGLQLLRAEYP